MSEEILSIDRVFTTISELNSYILTKVLSAEMPYKSIALSRTVDYDGLCFIHIEIDEVTKFSIQIKNISHYYEENLYRVTVRKTIEMHDDYQIEKIAKIVDLYSLLRNELDNKIFNIKQWPD